MGTGNKSKSGEVKASAEHEEKVVITEIDYSENQFQRDFFDLQHQRKQNVYRFSDFSQ